MSLKNSAERFGSLTKFLHWIIFALFMVEFFLVYRREYFPKDSAEKAQYMLLHKSFGICVLFLALCMIATRFVGKHPLLPMNMSPLEIIAAKFTHFILYLVMLFMPVTGIGMSLIGGGKVSFFGLVDLPNYFTKNEDLAGNLYYAHVWCSYVIIAFVSVHVLAALFHHFIRKDAILKRMLPFN